MGAVINPIIAEGATIRAGNAPGLRVYVGMGFRHDCVPKAVPLSDGDRTDRGPKCYDVAAAQA